MKVSISLSMTRAEFDAQKAQADAAGVTLEHFLSAQYGGIEVDVSIKDPAARADPWASDSAERNAPRDEDQGAPAAPDKELAEMFAMLDQLEEQSGAIASALGDPVPCPECGGNGSVGGGSLGDICVGCMGNRVVENPMAEQLLLPDVKGMRMALREANGKLLRGVPRDQIDWTSLRQQLASGKAALADQSLLAQRLERRRLGAQRRRELPGHDED